jgi:hypothetical protein
MPDENEEEPTVDEIDQMISALGAFVPSLDRVAERVAWSRVEARMAEEKDLAISLRLAGGSTKRRRRRRVYVAVAASVSILVLLAGAFLPARLGGPSSAEATLRSLAAVARGQAATTIPASSYLLTAETQSAIVSGSSVDGTAWDYRSESTRTAWLAADGSGRIVTAYGVPTFLTAADERTWLEAGSPELVPSEPEVEDLGPGAFLVIDLSGLAEDPDELLAQLHAGVVGERVDGADETFDLVGQLLAEQLAPPATRATLFEVAATLPGVEALGTIDDPTGRPGIGVRLGTSDRSTTLIFDPTTSDLLAQIDARLIDGTAQAQWRAFEPAEIVGDLGQGA